MEDEKQAQLIRWFDELIESGGEFEDMENKPHETQAVSAILFLYNKLKKENRPQRYFLHGEHDVLYIGMSFDLFSDFTKEDVKTCRTLGIDICDTQDGFSIYASM